MRGYLKVSRSLIFAVALAVLAIVSSPPTAVAERVLVIEAHDVKVDVVSFDQAAQRHYQLYVRQHQGLKADSRTSTPQRDTAGQSHADTSAITGRRDGYMNWRTRNV